MRCASLEERMTGLEKQIADLQGKPVTTGPDPFLLHQVNALSQKVEALEERSKHTTELKAKPSLEKPEVTAQKRYHTVQKGETLLKIGKKYGIAAEELRKLNNLSKGQSVKIGQKLLVSVER